MDGVLEGEGSLSDQSVGKVAQVQTWSLDDSDPKPSTSLEESCHSDSNLNDAKAKHKLSSLWSRRACTDLLQIISIDF